MKEYFFYGSDDKRLAGISPVSDEYAGISNPFELYDALEKVRCADTKYSEVPLNRMNGRRLSGLLKKYRQMIRIKKADKIDFHRLEEISVAAMSEPWHEADFLAADKNEFAVILEAVNGDEPVGYAVGYFAADESELPSIAVSRRSRRMGAGSALLAALFREVKRHGAAKMFLEVRESNEAAISLYEKNGFITAGTRRHFYSDPEENALVMMKLL